jgi:hypothetical protein
VAHGVKGTGPLLVAPIAVGHNIMSLTRARIRTPFDGETIFLKHKVTQHY